MDPRLSSCSLRSQILSRRRPERAFPPLAEDRRSRVFGPRHHTDPRAEATPALLLWALLKRGSRTSEDFSSVRPGRFFSRRATRRRADTEPRSKAGSAPSVGRSDPKSFRARPASLSLRRPAPRDCLHHPASCHHKDPRSSERQSQPRPSPSPYRYLYIQLTRQHPSTPRYSCAQTHIDTPRPATARKPSRPKAPDSSPNPYVPHRPAHNLAPLLPGPSIKVPILHVDSRRPQLSPP